MMLNTPEKLSQPSTRIKCRICPHECLLAEGMIGVCGARTQEAGEILCANYGMATSLALDPIEKKPLARFHPGSYILSYGSFGCNLRCPFCQNYEIATASIMKPVATHYISPEQLIEKALSLKNEGNIGIAFTYNEPFIGLEYMLDVSKIAHDKGLVIAVVTNGYVCEDVWTDALPYIDAFNIDLKCYSELGYRSLNAPNGLSVVKKSIETAYNAGVHLEVTTLITPGLFDNEDEFSDACKWLSSVGRDIPLHISRFFPCYKAMDKDPTDLKVMTRFERIANDYLDTVFLGNV